MSDPRPLGLSEILTVAIHAILFVSPKPSLLVGSS